MTSKKISLIVPLSNTLIKIRRLLNTENLWKTTIVKKNARCKNVYSVFCICWMTNGDQGCEMPWLKFVRFWHVYKLEYLVHNLEKFFESGNSLVLRKDRPVQDIVPVHRGCEIIVQTLWRIVVFGATRRITSSFSVKSVYF